jgi:hypothetical protein
MLRATFAADTGGEQVAHWRFEEVRQIAQDVPDGRGADDGGLKQGTKVRVVLREQSVDGDELQGFYRIVPGVSGNALRLGGIDSYVECEAGQELLGNGPFSIGAWIALGAFPVNWCPIVASATDSDGVVFGIDAHGRLGLQVALDGGWQDVVSTEQIPLGKWMHVACTFRPNASMSIFINGKLVGECALTGQLIPSRDSKLLIGRHPVAHQPDGTIRAHATAKAHTYFDGVLDELVIHDRTLTAAELLREWEVAQPMEPPQLPERRLPSFATATAAFGANYATLPYYDAWDARWQVGDAADVVVRFDENPCKFVFWRGTSYIPHWLTENDIWYNNEFVETWNDQGCHEPMSDKQCRYAHVRILESNPARVVVQWRYALADNWYSIFRGDEPNNWGEWVDEVYTVYPDAIGVRRITLYSTDPHSAPYEWNEAIVVMGPGQRPEDVLQPKPVTLLNLAGQSHTYSWVGGPPGPPELPQNATIERINTKSKYQPFLAFPTSAKPVFDIYAGEQRPEFSMFPWWNHWPTAFDPCDGRYAMAADRAAHSSLTHCTWGVYQETDGSLTKIMLNGVTDKSDADLARVVRGWDSPPALSVLSGEFASEGYDPTQRTYVLRRTGGSTDVALMINAAEGSPIENLAIIVRGWGDYGATVQIDGKSVDARVGRRSTLDGTDLIVWVPTSAVEPIRVEISSD